METGRRPLVVRGVRTRRGLTIRSTWPPGRRCQGDSRLCRIMSGRGGLVAARYPLGGRIRRSGWERGRTCRGCGLVRVHSARGSARICRASRRWRVDTAGTGRECRAHAMRTFGICYGDAEVQSPRLLFALRRCCRNRRQVVPHMSRRVHVGTVDGEYWTRRPWSLRGRDHWQAGGVASARE